MVGLRLELARLTGTSETSSDTEAIKALVNEANEKPIKQLFTLVDTTELNRFLEDTVGRELCFFLDSFQHGDSSLQFLRLSNERLSEDRMPEDYCVLIPWEILKYHCKMANISQSFYRHISEDQWLLTMAVERQSEEPVFEIHNNVVPKQAYLQRFKAVTANCSGNGCCGGFFQASAFDQLRAPPFQTCTNCALVQQLRGRANVDCGIVRFWYMEKDEVKMAGKNARIGGNSTEGEVHKVLWRHGIFARKSFLRDLQGSIKDEDRKCPSFDNELMVAFAVTHPNIVHFFGYTVLVSHESIECHLFMELLEDDLETHLQKPDQSSTLISFPDVLHILLQVAEAMEHIHEKQFVHGDLKPGNILVSQLTMPCHPGVNPDDKFYLVKVADFGNTQRVNNSGVVEKFNPGIGTLRYTAPEVLVRRAEKQPWKEFLYPEKLDVYSYAVVAYQVLTRTTCNEVAEGWSRDGVIKPDTDPGQWRPDKNFGLSTLGPDRQELLGFIRTWWASAPESRPTFTEICDVLRTLQRTSVN